MNDKRTNMCTPLTYYQMSTVSRLAMCFYVPCVRAETWRRWRWWLLFVIDLCTLRRKYTVETWKGFGAFSNVTKICICVNVVINSKPITAFRFAAFCVAHDPGDFYYEIIPLYFVAFNYSEFFVYPFRFWSPRILRVNWHCLEIE